MGHSSDTHWILIRHSLDTYWTLIRYSSDTNQTLIRHLLDTHRTLIRHSSDTHQTLIGHSSDTHRTIIRNSSDTYRTFAGLFGSSYIKKSFCLVLFIIQNLLRHPVKHSKNISETFEFWCQVKLWILEGLLCHRESWIKAWPIKMLWNCVIFSHTELTIEWKNSTVSLRNFQWIGIFA